MILRARIPMAWICQLKMLRKYLVLQLRAKRSKDVMTHHKNDDGCPRKREREVKQQCSECHNHMCKQHSKELL